MSRFIFSMEAVVKMVAKCFKAVCNETETGGVLVGPMSDRRIITDVIESSMYAERGAVTYFQSEEDVAYLNSQLRLYQARGYDFGGYWHLHPSGLYSLSHGDKDTCSGVLHNPSYKIDNLLLMVIIADVSGNSGLPLFAYAASFNEHAKLDVQRVPVKVMPKRMIEEYLIETEEEEEEENKDIGGKDESNDDRQVVEKAEAPDAEGDTLRPSGEGDSDSCINGDEEGLK